MKYEHFLSSFKTAVCGGSLLQSRGRLRLEKLVDLEEKTVSISGELSSLSDETPNVIPTKTFRRWSMRLLFGTAVMRLGLLSLVCTTLISGVQAITNPDVRNFDGLLSLLLFPASSTLIAAFGFASHYRVQGEVNNQPHDVLSPYTAPDASTTWEHFLRWAKAEQLVLLFKVAQSSYRPFPVEVWDSPFIATLIFGTSEQRKALVFSGLDPLTNLVISSSEWERFIALKPVLDIKPAPSSPLDSAKNSSIAETAHILDVQVDNFKVIQEPRKGSFEYGSNKYPEAPTKSFELSGPKRYYRQKMLVSNREFILRYLKLGIKRNTLNSRQLPYHDVIIVMSENFDKLPLYFPSLNDTTNDEYSTVDIAEIERQMQSALKIKGDKKISRQLVFKRLSWNAFEKYLLKCEIIKDAEVSVFAQFSFTKSDSPLKSNESDVWNV